MGSTTVLGDIEILSDVINRGTPDFDSDAARAMLSLEFSESQRRQMLELADKSNRGELSPTEQEQIESYRRVGNFLALLHARARLSLQRLSSGAEQSH
jgi:hypothetical protein